MKTEQILTNGLAQETIAGLLFRISLAAAICAAILGGGCIQPAATNNSGAPPDTVPDFGAATFTNPLVIDNSHFPLIVGTGWTYMAESNGDTERTIVEVLDETHAIMGVTCRVVRDQVHLNDVLIEDTRDWYAQDDDGNVWYMGETVDNYNYDDQGVIIDIDHDGSWEAGQDVADVGFTALPGYQMKANPAAGEVYSQEYYEGEAEDMAEVVALNVEVTLADASTYSALQTRDYNPLEADSEENKYYAPGVGLVLEEKPDSGERAELVSVEP